MDAKPDRQPTKAELQILEVLWREGPSSVRRVWEALDQKTSYTSVLKTMQVMRDKNLLHRDESAISHIYAPAIERAENQRRMVDDLLARAFNGSASELVQQALSRHPVSADELRLIRQTLARMRKDGKTPL
jgi:BlaI family transcriptional regulator, penicillinase repressor